MLLKLYKQLFKNHYPDFVRWSQHIPIDTPISSVKLQVPEYIIIDWDSPVKFGKGFLYPVLKVKGQPINNSSDYLGFVDGLYAGHIFRK